MRATFSDLLVAAANQNEKLLLLTGDHGYALFDKFRSCCPSQYLNCGVAEQNMVGVAAGLAKGGFRPIVYGLSAFVPMRVLEQIKLDICYETLPIVFVGDGAGMVYGQWGASHQCTEDVAALRAMPNMSIVSPADRYELEYCFTHALEIDGPIYLRFGKADRGNVHDAVPQHRFGSLIQVRSGTASFAFIGTGAMVRTAIELAETFENVPVWSSPVIVPINEAQVIDVCRAHDHIFVFEEHSIYGGLGSLVAELVSEQGGPRVTRFGVRGKFSDICGSYSYLLSYHGLGVSALHSHISRVLAHSPQQQA